ncbi:MAG: ABC-2 family transporter protein [Lachnospiraceae bacterium]|nr:ABC-2 family transporter protein [Lachnospiraceae bacterium]
MRLAPYLAYFKKSFLNRSAYRFDHLMGILSTCLRMFIFWEIYKALYGGRQQVDGITMSMVTTNFILSMGMEAAFYVDDFFMPHRINNGSIATELLRPMSFKGRMIAENMGNAAFHLCFRFGPAFVIACFLMGIQLPASPKMFVMFLVSGILGYGVLWTISFAVQMLAFWLVNVWSVVTIKNVFINVLSGTMIPLWFMPDWMEGVLHVTPFSSIYFTPVQIYLGQLTIGEIALKCGVQMFWIVVLYLVGDVLWRRGQKKLVVQGG